MIQGTAGSLFPLITRRPYQRGGICMNTLKGNEEAVRRGSYGAALGIGELSERYMMDFSSWDEKQNEVEFNSATNGSCCQVFVHAGNVGAEASHLMCCILNAKLNISVLKLWILSFLKHEWICTLTLKKKDQGWTIICNHILEYSHQGNVESHNGMSWQQHLAAVCPHAPPPNQSAGTLFLWDRKPYEQIMGERQFK